MNKFYEYLERKGIKDAKNVTGFVHEFLHDPSIFFDLTGTERDEMGKNWIKPLTFLGKKRVITLRISFDDAVLFDLV